MSLFTYFSFHIVDMYQQLFCHVTVEEVSVNSVFLTFDDFKGLEKHYFRPNKGLFNIKNLKTWIL